ncbi:DUF2817 domain-containing protein [Candidatus Peregrinibacteria bacterium]|jgi:hypothetical protein|nr:DUF2817 domain-containing protein [Candidatus Peregrinibacteria bacterium]MBT4148445.1 DUF2817 domain-containing protein [Candidatus Peregrinibacteria bacterium]MBT4456486.1 DUF2817 domain-containing protein [Candidatus Peregrinibacteria bacterium]
MNRRKSIKIKPSNKFLPILCSVSYNKKKYQIHYYKHIKSPKKPTLVITANIHGIEKISSLVALDFCKKMVKLGQKSPVNFVCIPCLNPFGLAHKTRCNGNGVDLMRNSPLRTKKKTFFFGGQNWSNRLPYFQGEKLEKENEIWLKLMKKIWKSTKGPVFHIDIHSGFGWKTSIWPPHTRSFKTKRNKQLFLPFKKMAAQNGMKYSDIPYNISGDMLDHLYELSPRNRAAAATMEIGTWKWIYTMPWRIGLASNWFNPPEKILKKVVREHSKALMTLVNQSHKPN